MRHEHLKEIVSDPEWQKLRKSLLGKWRLHAVENLDVLKAYLGDLSAVNREDPKFLRVFNYLTGSGFRIGIISHPAIDEYLTKLRQIRYGAQVQVELDKLEARKAKLLEKVS